jgi:hypothetical protein
MSKPQFPKALATPPTRQIKIGGNPENFDTLSIAWHFHRRDRQHSLWGWNKLMPREWRDILKHLEALERMTWAQIKAQAGGRRAGTNSHSLDVCDFCHDARKRLEEIGLDDCDNLFSLRLNNKLRLYGFRDGRVLQLIWHDPHHGSGNGAFPTA